MTIREASRLARQRFERAGVPNASLDANLLLAYVLHEEWMRMRLDDMREVSPAQLSAYEELVARRETREPLQYILGETEFMGLAFHVEPGVLIPRQDTEILCEEALRRLSERGGGRVLDIGTGSGALAVSIAVHCKGAQVTAVDVSDDALRIAKENARRLGAQVRFVKSDLFAALSGETFDMIVSNPPYIPPSEMDELMPEVRCEPELALRGGDDGLSFYRRITADAPGFLAPGGCLLFEIGWQQKDDVCALLDRRIGAPFALRDYGGNWRVCGAAMGEMGHA